MKRRSRRWRGGGEILRLAEFVEGATRSLLGWYHGLSIAACRKLTVRELCFYLEPTLKKKDEQEEE